MSGHGAPTLSTDAAGLRVAVVAASWHEKVMNGLIDGARRGLADAGVRDDDVTLVRVPGTFELTAACARLAPHFDYVCSAATDGLTQIGVTTGKAIGFGVLTCDTDAQALDRAGLEGSSEDKGHEAATAAVVTEMTLRSLQLPAATL